MRWYLEVICAERQKIQPLIDKLSLRIYIPAGISVDGRLDSFVGNLRVSKAEGRVSEHVNEHRSLKSRSTAFMFQQTDDDNRFKFLNPGKSSRDVLVERKTAVGRGRHFTGKLPEQIASEAVARNCLVMIPVRMKLENASPKAGALPKAEDG
jgi:hypothetical protein